VGNGIVLNRVRVNGYFWFLFITTDQCDDEQG